VVTKGKKMEVAVDGGRGEKRLPSGTTTAGEPHLWSKVVSLAKQMRRTGQGIAPNWAENSEKVRR